MEDAALFRENVSGHRPIVMGYPRWIEGSGIIGMIAVQT
jgi:hypothetical protein